MTHTKPDLLERAPETSQPKQRGVRLWAALMILVVVAIGGLAAVLFWPDGEEATDSGDGPPYGLIGIEQPSTEAEVLAVLESLPAIAGRQPIFDAAVAATSYEAAGLQDWLGIGARFVGTEPLEYFEPEIREAEGATIEGSDLDPNSDLLWLAFNHELESFSVMWADPAGPWLFHATGDTVEFRAELIEGFVAAVAG